jgi:hypothetical protein
VPVVVAPSSRSRRRRSSSSSSRGSRHFDNMTDGFVYGAAAVSASA